MREFSTAIPIRRILWAQQLQEKYDVVGDVRGGEELMTALELVNDRAAKTPLDMDAMKRVHQATYEVGSMIRLGMNSILMSPPLTISEAEVDVILSALDAGLAAV